MNTTKENAGWEIELLQVLDDFCEERTVVKDVRSFITRVVAEAVAERDRELREQIETNGFLKAMREASDVNIKQLDLVVDCILFLLTKNDITNI